jgi:hypothetical protein
LKTLFQWLFAQIAEELGDLSSDLFIVWSGDIDLDMLPCANAKRKDAEHRCGGMFWTLEASDLNIVAGPTN